MPLVQLDPSLPADGAQAGLRIVFLFVMEDTKLLEVFASGVHSARHAVGAQNLAVRHIYHGCDSLGI